MRKTLTALLAATTLGVAALPSSAEARWGWGWGWGGGVGLAAGAIIGGALARPYYPYYGYGYGYGYPAYYPGLLPRALRLLLWWPAILRLLSLLAPSLLVTERRVHRAGSLKQRLTASHAPDRGMTVHVLTPRRWKRGVQIFQLLRRERQRQRHRILFDMGDGARFRNRNDAAAAHRPGQRHRGRRTVVRRADARQRGIA